MGNHRPATHSTLRIPHSAFRSPLGRLAQAAACKAVPPSGTGAIPARDSNFFVAAEVTRLTNANRRANYRQVWAFQSQPFLNVRQPRYLGCYNSFPGIGVERYMPVFQTGVERALLLMLDRKFTRLLLHAIRATCPLPCNRKGTLCPKQTRQPRAGSGQIRVCDAPANRNPRKREPPGPAECVRGRPMR